MVGKAAADVIATLNDAVAKLTVFVDNMKFVSLHAHELLNIVDAFNQYQVECLCFVCVCVCV